MMFKYIKNAVRRTVQVARSIYSGKPEDSIGLRNEIVNYVTDGERGQAALCDIGHISVDQSFLGLFGSSLKLRLKTNAIIRVKGINDAEANEFKAQCDKGIEQLLIRNAQQQLAQSSRLISEAWESLQRDSYLSYQQICRWQEDYADLKFLSVLREDLVATSDTSGRATECRQVLTEPDIWRAQRNDTWVEGQLKKLDEYFKTTHPLEYTTSQKEAILRHDNRVLAVAGAGTGKTATVVGKVKYLLDHQLCRPEEILLLSFSTGAVEELANRIRTVCGDGVQVRTFHSLGLEIIINARKSKPAVFEFGEGNQLRKRVSAYLRDMLNDNETYATLINFLVYQFYPTRTDADFSSLSEMLDHAQKYDLQTLQGEKVRSNQEVQIANWLFMNSINYIYEAEFREAATGSIERRVYKPDFYLPDYGIYIEHFGVDRAGNPAPYINADRYRAGMEWKRTLHREHNTRFIQTYSYQAFEGDLAACLESELQRYGVPMQKRSRIELLAHRQIEDRLKNLTKLICTAICLFKGDRLKMEDITAQIDTSQDKKRESAFLLIFEGCLLRYQNDLRIRGEIDFGDMISQAAKHVESGEYRSPFTVVVVDEFQDISRGRAWLMNSLLEQHTDARLLCVGDDWQSIYRFTGSDVNLMTGYKEQWPQAVRVDLNQTFRFNDEIQKVTSRFITQNPIQLKKAISCGSSTGRPAIRIVNKELPDILTEIRHNSPKAGVLVLGRYRHTAATGDINQNNVEAMTVHKSKGLENEYVVIQNVEFGAYGFPSEIVDDPIIRLFLADADTYPNAEERRLFYVALTRARKEVWIRADPAKASSFIRELIAETRLYSGLIDYDMSAFETEHKCPLCKGNMVKKKRRSDGHIFLGCTRYPRCKGTLSGCPQCGQSMPTKQSDHWSCTAQGCNWSAKVCPACGRGYIGSKKGKYGVFESCSLYRTTGCRGK